MLVVQAKCKEVINSLRIFLWGSRGSNSPEPNYEFGAFTRSLDPQESRTKAFMMIVNWFAKSKYIPDTTKMFNN